MAVSKRLRFEVLRRDNHSCRYCGRTAPEVPLTVDHVKPVALGGGDTADNLVASCRDCNSGKSSVPADAPLVDNVANDALRWAAAMRQAADELAAADEVIESILDAVYEAWKPRYIPRDWAPSVVTFVKAGLDQEALLYLTDIALRARVGDRWAYFCGCCWKRIRQMQDRAQQIVSEGAPPTEAPLTTSWASASLDELVSASEQTAERWLTQESIDSAYCNHRDWGQGDCGDPMCRVQRAEGLSWMAYRSMNSYDRDCAVMDVAEALLDG